jgi:hypothetical protein
MGRLLHSLISKASKPFTIIFKIQISINIILYKVMIMFYGTDNVMQNIVMAMNNVMNGHSMGNSTF